MSVWTAASTLILLSPPGASSNTAKNTSVVPAIGESQLLSKSDFDSLWQTFFDEPMSFPKCGSPKELQGSDAHLIERDSFLVQLRGFRSSICSIESWFVASLRIDPCRVRLGKENKSLKAIQKCSEQGKFSEVRVVLQPVEKTDRGNIYPDVALHLAYTIPEFSKLSRIWNSSSPNELIAKLRKDGIWNDASLFLGGAGLERWTFARALFEKGRWRRDKLPHGGFFESISDADLVGGSTRTQRPSNERSLTRAQILKPLLTHPLQGSCVSCHLAEDNRPARLFRQLGWGLSGEEVVSARVKAEAEFAARELNVIEKNNLKK